MALPEAIANLALGQHPYNEKQYNSGLEQIQGLINQYHRRQYEQPCAVCLRGILLDIAFFITLLMAYAPSNEPIDNYADFSRLDKISKQLLLFDRKAITKNIWVLLKRKMQALEDSEFAKPPPCASRKDESDEEEDSNAEESSVDDSEGDDESIIPIDELSNWFQGNIEWPGHEHADQVMDETFEQFNNQMAGLSVRAETRCARAMQAPRIPQPEPVFQIQGFANRAQGHRFANQSQSLGFTNQSQSLGFSNRPQSQGFANRHPSVEFANRPQSQGFTGQTQIQGFSNLSQNLGFTTASQSQGFANQSQSLGFTNGSHTQGPTTQAAPPLTDPSNVLTIHADSVDVGGLETGVFIPVIILTPMPALSSTYLQHQPPTQAFAPSFYQPLDFNANPMLQRHPPNQFITSSSSQPLDFNPYPNYNNTNDDNSNEFEACPAMTSPINPRALESFLAPSWVLRDPVVYDSQWAE